MAYFKAKLIIVLLRLIINFLSNSPLVKKLWLIYLPLLKRGKSLIFDLF